jgi:hypothetical protein
MVKPADIWSNDIGLSLNAITEMDCNVGQSLFIILMKMAIIERDSFAGMTFLDG